MTPNSDLSQTEDTSCHGEEGRTGHRVLKTVAEDLEIHTLTRTLRLRRDRIQKKNNPQDEGCH